MSIFGLYGQVIDQDALEDKYNDCFSRKLFLVADEVIARQEMYHVKNKLKGMITGTRIRINPKNVKSYWETNHCNIIFLSNETMPLVLERDDGRFVVVWTPPKLSEAFYKDVCHRPSPLPPRKGSCCWRSASRGSRASCEPRSARSSRSW